MLCALLLASQLCWVPRSVAGPVEVPFRRTQEAILVDATVNGRRLSLMFDTGFAGAIDADEGIDLGKPTGKQTLRDFLGVMEAATVKITSFKLGDQTIDCEGMDAVQTPASEYTYIFGTHCDGLMGFEAIRKNVTEINFEKSRFIFYPSTMDITKRVPDNKRTFLLKMLPTGDNSVQLQSLAPGGQSLTLALDTGNSFFATTYRESLERVGLWGGGDAKFGSLSGIASGAAESWEVKMPALTVFGVPVSSSVWEVLDRPSSDAAADGTVGYEFLKNFNIVIDYERRRVWLDNYTGVTGNEAPGQIGISAGYSVQHKSVIVARVSPGSPAEVAGIREKDVILSVDGVDLTRQSFKQMRVILAGDVGSKVKLAVSRDGALRRYVIERRPLVNLATGAAPGT